MSKIGIFPIILICISIGIGIIQAIISIFYLKVIMMKYAYMIKASFLIAPFVRIPILTLILVGYCFFKEKYYYLNLFVMIPLAYIVGILFGINVFMPDYLKYSHMIIFVVFISLILVYLISRISSNAHEELVGSVFFMSFIAFYMPYDIWFRKFLLAVGVEMNKLLNLGTEFTLINTDLLIWSEYMLILGIIFMIPFIIYQLKNMYQQKIDVRKLFYLLLPVVIYFISYFILMLTNQYSVVWVARSMLLTM